MNKGFTIIKFSILLLMISLIVSGILVGQNLAEYVRHSSEQGGIKHD